MKYSEKNQKIIFEVGDWVVYKPGAVVKAFKLDNIDGEIGKNSHRTTMANNATLELKQCRLASQNEIDAAMAELKTRPADQADPVQGKAEKLIRKVAALLEEEGWLD